MRTLSIREMTQVGGGLKYEPDPGDPGYNPNPPIPKPTASATLARDAQGNITGVKANWADTYHGTSGTAAVGQNTLTITGTNGPITSSYSYVNGQSTVTTSGTVSSNGVTFTGSYDSNGNLVGNISTTLAGNTVSVAAGNGAPTLSYHVPFATGAAADITISSDHKSASVAWNYADGNYVAGISGGFDSVKGYTIGGYLGYYWGGAGTTPPGVLYPV